MIFTYELSGIYGLNPMTNPPYDEIPQKPLVQPLVADDIIQTLQHNSLFQLYYWCKSKSLLAE